jgi:aryl-alcohol dehydrogenase-like predicted oxidoreductase
MERGQLEKLMEARSNKTFSMQEKIMEKAKLEAIGISEQEAENTQDIFIQQHMHYFPEYTLANEEPDAIIFDTANYNHKAVRYTKPK